MGILRTDKISGLETPTIITGAVDFKGGDTGIGLTSPASADFNFDIYDFTVEWFQYWNSISGFQTLLDIDNVTGLLIESGNGTGAYRVYCDNTLEAQESTSNGAVAGRWYHYAVVGDRANGTVKIYRDGIETGTGNWADDKLAGSATHTLGIGVDVLDEDRNINGYISNLRILKGTALYKSNFTPPTHELEAINDTVLLCCNNSDSVTAASRAGIGSAHILAAKGSVSIASTNPGLTRNFTYGTEFNGVTTFDTQGYFVPPSGTTEQRNGGRGLVGGGEITPASESESNHIDYITISSTGNSQDFGDLSDGKLRLGASGSSTRGIFAGGKTPSLVDVMEFVTIATRGDALDFGDLLNARDELGGAGNNIRALFFTGSAPSSTNVIEYVTTAALGNAQDFGDLTRAEVEGCGCGSPTRGIFFIRDNSINYVTWATTGNAQDFGDTGFGENGDNMAVSDRTRAIIAGGAQGPSNAATGIHYLIISTLGNTQEFGDLTATAREGSGMSNSIRGVFSLGIAGGSQSNAMDYITIATNGDAKDFGDLTPGKIKEGSACSDSHGGIS